jgi:hypothetical protein
MINRILGLVAVSSVLALAGCVADAGPGSEEQGEDEALEQPDLQPAAGDKAVFPTFDQHVSNQGKPGGAAGPVASITYHGGAIMSGTVNLYYIWYGNWAGNTATTILTDLANGISGSPYWGINTSYYQGTTTKTYVSNSTHYAGSTTDAYSQGTSLSDAAIQTVVSSAITSGKLPKDTNGIYFVLTSTDVTASSGFCTQYCGWHTHGTIGGSNIKYSFVGNADRCLSSCGAQTVGPNGNAGADAMASIIMHEAEEATSDPDLNAWYDKQGAENADKCAWSFGTTYSSGGALANVKLGTRDFLIQRNWKASTQSCGMN